MRARHAKLIREGILKARLPHRLRAYYVAVELRSAPPLVRLAFLRRLERDLEKRSA